MTHFPIDTHTHHRNKNGLQQIKILTTITVMSEMKNFETVEIYFYKYVMKQQIYTLRSMISSVK